MTTQPERPGGPGILHGVRVVEIGDETVAHTGLHLAGLGADVIKVEPPEGSSTRGIGPFLGARSGENSLFFWQHNRGKRSLVLEPDDVDTLLGLIGTADVLLVGGSDAARLLADTAIPEAGRGPDDAVR